MLKSLLQKKNKKPFKLKCPEEKIVRPQKVYKLVPISKITSEMECRTRFNAFGHTPFNIGVNSKYLNDALKIYTDEVELRMSSAVSPIIVTQDGENLELVLPIRIREE